MHLWHVVSNLKHKIDSTTLLDSIQFPFSIINKVTVSLTIFLSLLLDDHSMRLKQQFPIEIWKNFIDMRQWTWRNVQVKFHCRFLSCFMFIFFRWSRCWEEEESLLRLCSLITTKCYANFCGWKSQIIIINGHSYTSRWLRIDFCLTLPKKVCLESLWKFSGRLYRIRYLFKLSLKLGHLLVENRNLLLAFKSCRNFKKIFWNLL